MAQQYNIYELNELIEIVKHLCRLFSAAFGG